MAQALSRGRPSTTGEAASEAETTKRWITIWAVILVVVTVVVVLSLIAITQSLAGINGDLAVADEAVTGAGGDVVTLPQQVDTVNNSLAGIEPNVAPLAGMADSIIASLRGIDAKLASTDSSLKDTSSVLKVVLGQTGTIHGVLVDADDPPDRLGVQNIHQRVAFANGVGSPPVAPGDPRLGHSGPFGVNPSNLTAVEGDLRNILSGLVDVNKHLSSICRSPAVQLTGPKPC